MPFITFEGIEGCGKSTQARLLAEVLGKGVCLTREPGGTELGRGIRALVLDHRGHDVSAEAEVLLFFADRAQHVREVVRPALQAGRTVISDRYVDSSLAYQGYGRGLSLTLLSAVAELATGGLRPDLTVWLDVPVEVGLTRVGRRGDHDRLESEAREFHERVRGGYAALLAREPQRWIQVEATGSPQDVGTRVLSALRARGWRTDGVR
jgi:dTMP kinase